jgi:uncharacterized repeat protein (TIGR01451 family)/LPXTG-motif cell wall-anchored protein
MTTARNNGLRRVAALVTAAVLAVVWVAVPVDGAYAAPTHSRPGMDGHSKTWAGLSPNQQDWWVWLDSPTETINVEVRIVANNVTGGKTPQIRTQTIRPDGTVGPVGAASTVGGTSMVTATGVGGLWKVVFDAPTQTDDADGQWYFDYDIWVTSSGGGDEVGRVFADHFRGAQQTTPYIDFDMYVVADDGSVFETTFTQYRGIDSVIAADGLGLYQVDGCLPTGKSYGGTTYGAPDYDFDAVKMKTDCGQPRFNLFADAPSDVLPETAVHAGQSVMVYPRYQIPTAPNPNLKIADGASWDRPFEGAGGTLGIDGFRGLYQVRIDVNNDGDWSDPVDVSLDYEKVTAAGDVTWTWDGKDGEGQYVTRDETPTVTVQLIKGNEYYQVLVDVESINGVEIRELAGYNATKAGGPVYPAVHWDDTPVLDQIDPGHQVASLLSPAMVTTPPDGVSSQGGVHGWQEIQQPGQPLASWGNNSYISLGTYANLAADNTLISPQTTPVFRSIEMVSKVGVLNPASGAPGSETRTIDYTVKIKNVSLADGDGLTDFTTTYPASFVDVLPAHVTGWTGAATSYDQGSSPGAATVVEAGGTVTWSGPLKAGETATLTYRVTVDAGFSAQRVNQAAIVDCPATFDVAGKTVTTVCNPDPVDATVPLPGLKIEKQVDTTGLHKAGHSADYAVTITNIGLADFTAADPAYVFDDLAAVLDDATLEVATLSPPEAVWDGGAQRITWSGPLAVGDSIAVTYTVVYDPQTTVDADLLLENTAWIRHVDVLDVTPGEQVSTETPGSDLHVWKTVDKTTVEPGDTVTYTINLSNEKGQTAAPVDLVDELSGVLDDAVWVLGPTATAPVTASRTGDVVIIGGQVAAGGTASVTYQVQVKADSERGDHVLRNAVHEPGPWLCPPGTPLCTTTPVESYRVDKTVNQTVVGAGDEAVYTVLLTNTGASDVTVNEVDNLASVLDDADLIVEPVSDRGTVVVVWDAASRTIRISGLLPAPAGTTAAVTYTVKVRPYSGRGDNTLDNVVVQDPPDPGDPGDPGDLCGVDDPRCTSTPVDDYTLVKTVDREVAAPGDLVVYTLTLTNRGSVAASIDALDHLVGVLDDADLVVAPASDVGSLNAVFDAEGQRIAITGSIPAPAGSTGHVTYTVQVRPYSDRGDHTLDNVVLLGPDQPGGQCAADDPLCTSTPVQDLGVAKSVDQTTLKYRDVATFQVVFTNRGATDALIGHHDLLGWVVDDGELQSHPVVDHPAVEVSWVAAANRIEVSGLLQAGEAATVTYQVKVVRPADFWFHNYVLAYDPTDPYEPDSYDPTKRKTPPVCDVTAGMVCTVTPITPFNPGTDFGVELPLTGSTATGWLVMIAFGVTALGVALVGRRRRATRPRFAF